MTNWNPTPGASRALDSKLLVIDDDPNSLAVVTDYLSSHALRVLVAEDGASGLTRAAHARPDLILLDVMMPGMDGFETCRRLKALDATSDIPVIFMTALAATEHKVRGFEAGAVDFIIKPFQREEVLARVGVHLHIRELSENLKKAKEELEKRVEQRTEELARANDALRSEVAERKRAEAALVDAARRKDDFIAMLGHELRNPLAPIRNASYVLKLTGLTDPRARRANEMIDRQVTNLGRIVDDILDVTRMARGKVTLHKERLDWVKLVHTVVEDYRSEVEGKGVALSATLPSKPLWVWGDATRLYQVASNILDNAQKFTDCGGSIGVHLEERADDCRASLIVRDTGIGMAPDTLAALFAPFVQAKSDLARSRGGVGLGLALVKGLVELHAGTVQASSEGLGRGARLELDLPLLPDASVQPSLSPEPGASPRVRVLVVEDNADAAESLKMILDLAGHDVQTAGDGSSGLEEARRFQPATIICDIGLPGEMDGYSVARAVRADPALRSARLIAMTGYGQDQDRLRGREAGFDLHLTKPVDSAALLRSVSHGG